uniref:Uncharacterized protein n=1 Tax=Arundo donax TaxID=35708 RepID=A0A0A9AXK6_ARUDO
MVNRQSLFYFLFLHPAAVWSLFSIVAFFSFDSLSFGLFNS